MSGVDAPVTCYRHPRRETLLSCTRCERSICTDCLQEAPVGQRCPECAGPDRTRRGGTVRITYAIMGLILVGMILPGAVARFGNVGSVLVADGGYHEIGVLHGEWYRLITAGFVHTAVLHAALNLYWVWRLGTFLEQRVGAVRFAALYLVPAVGGSALEVAIRPHQTSIGASAAVSGLAGAYFVLTRRRFAPPPDGTRILVLFLLWMVLSAGFTSWPGHLGGLLAGVALALPFSSRPARRAGRFP